MKTAGRNNNYLFLTATCVLKAYKRYRGQVHRFNNISAVVKRGKYKEDSCYSQSQLIPRTSSHWLCGWSSLRFSHATSARTRKMTTTRTPRFVPRRAFCMNCNKVTKHDAQHFHDYGNDVWYGYCHECNTLTRINPEEDKKSWDRRSPRSLKGRRSSRRRTSVTRTGAHTAVLAPCRTTPSSTTPSTTTVGGATAVRAVGCSTKPNGGTHESQSAHLRLRVGAEAERRDRRAGVQRLHRHHGALPLVWRERRWLQEVTNVVSQGRGQAVQEDRGVPRQGGDGV